MINKTMKEFDETFPHIDAEVEWHTIKQDFRDFLNKTLKQAVIEGRIKENGRLYYHAHEFHNVSQNSMSCYQHLRDKELKESLKENK